MGDLRPCPFCGASGVVVSGGDPRGYTPGCASPDCILAVEEMGCAYETIEQAADAWNTRTGELSGEIESIPMTEENMAPFGWVRERTCCDMSSDPLRFRCTMCGSVSVEMAPRFCPNCGAKVVYA